MENRKYIDCRDFPESKCSVSFGADSERELLDVAVQHAVKSHGYQDSDETRDKIRKSFKTECRC